MKRQAVMQNVLVPIHFQTIITQSTSTYLVSIHLLNHNCHVSMLFCMTRRCLSSQSESVFEFLGPYPALTTTNVILRYVLSRRTAVCRCSQHPFLNRRWAEVREESKLLPRVTKMDRPLPTDRRRMTRTRPIMCRRRQLTVFIVG